MAAFFVLCCWDIVDQHASAPIMAKQKTCGLYWASLKKSGTLPWPCRFAYAAHWLYANHSLGQSLGDLEQLGPGNSSSFRIEVAAHLQGLHVEEPCVADAYANELSHRPPTLPSSPWVNGALDVVLSFSKEPLAALNGTMHELLKIPSVHSRGPRFVVVSKRFFNADMLFQATNAHVVISQPNIGREGLAFLAYIYAFYNVLPRHVIFLQAVMNEPENVVGRLTAHFTDSTGMLGLAMIGTCEYEATPGFGARMPRLRELWGIFRQSLFPPRWIALLNGQFLVSGRRIRANPLAKYVFMYYYLTRNSSHFTVHDYLRIDVPVSWDGVGRQKVCDAPLSSYTLERAWSFMFNCWYPAGTGDNCMPPYHEYCFKDVQCLDPA